MDSTVSQFQINNEINYLLHMGVNELTYQTSSHKANRETQLIHGYCLDFVAYNRSEISTYYLLSFLFVCLLFTLDLWLQLAQKIPLTALPFPLPCVDPFILPPAWTCGPSARNKIPPRWWNILSLWHKQETAVSHKSNLGGVTIPLSWSPEVKQMEWNIQ